MLHYSRVSKNFMHKNDISRFSVDYFLSHSTKKILEEPFCVSEKFCIETFYAQGGDITTFCWKLLVSNYLKNFVGEHFGESEKHCIENFIRWGDGGNIKIFRREDFVSLYRKIHRGTLRSTRRFRVTKKFMHKRGTLRSSVANFLSHSAYKHLRGTHLCFR